MNDKKTHIAVSNGTQPVSLFEDQKIRMAWDAEKEEWYFSIVDVVGVLTDSVDPTVYWRKLKQRLKAEGNETVTKCHGLKMTASDGKKRLTDVADTEQLLRADAIQALMRYSLVTACNQLKMRSPKDGINYLTDVSNAEAAKRAELAKAELAAYKALPWYKKIFG